MPIICDPSHITGKRELVADIAQKAMDMGFEGLMIETHPRPEEAWSDAAQQVTPDTLQAILGNLIVRNQFAPDDSHTVTLEHLRQLVDSLDAEIIDLIARRMELSERMGMVKKDANITAYQPERWREIVDTRGDRAEKLHLSRDFIVSLYEKIHDESIKKQLEILQSILNEVKG